MADDSKRYSAVDLSKVRAPNFMPNLNGNAPADIQPLRYPDEVGMVGTAEVNPQMIARHLPYSEFDLAGIMNAVNRYKQAGLRADYDPARQKEGVVRIVFDNPMRMDGSLAAFDVHKLAKNGWFRERPYWIIQIWSQEPGQKEPVRKGCVFGKIQAKAITEAETDLRHGFISVCDFKLATSALL